MKSPRWRAAANRTRPRFLEEDWHAHRAPKYRRILLKVSGEALMGAGQFGIDIDVIDRIARDVKEAHSAGTEICMVVGGGNIFRGLAGSAKGTTASTADYMGMLATVMNALALQAGLEAGGPGIPRPVGHRHEQCLRALYPPPGHPAHGKGPGGDLRRRHRQSLLHH